MSVPRCCASGIIFIRFRKCISVQMRAHGTTHISVKCRRAKLHVCGGQIRYGSNSNSANVYCAADIACVSVSVCVCTCLCRVGSLMNVERDKVNIVFRMKNQLLYVEH